MKTTFPICLVLTLAWAFPFSSCRPAPSTGTSAQNGCIDLSGHDFSGEGPVALSGDWHYIPGRIVSPSELARPAGPGTELAAELTRVPGFWKPPENEPVLQRGYGSGTCWVDVKLPPGGANLMLQTSQIHSSYLLYLDGKPFGGPLVTEGSDESRVASNKPGYYHVGSPGESLRIVLNVANYWDHAGTGLPKAPRIGLAEDLEREHAINAAYESFIAGFLLLSALYHLMLYLIQRRDRALLLFSLISLTAFVRQLSTSEYFWLGLAGFPMYAVIRIEVATVFLICLLFNLYFGYVYRPYFPRPLYVASVVEGTALAAITLLSPARVYSWLLVPLYAYGIQTAVQALYTIGGAIKHREPLSAVMFAGTALYALPSVTDILSTTILLDIPYLMPLGLFPFIMAQAYILAKRYTKAAEEAENLRVTTARLTQLDEAKTNFLANITHELRTPLTLIRAPVEAIQKGEYGAEIPGSHPVFSVIRSNVDRLLRLIENLLNLTRLETTQPYDLVPVDIRQLLPVYLDEFRALAGSKEISLELEMPKTPCVAEIDYKAFETILFNLLSNALKFTGRGGRVSVRIGMVEENGERFMRVEVADTGCGIDAEDMQYLFVRYRRIYDRERHHYDGTGLGLSIAHETARALGGELSATSEPGKGSSFRLDLPESGRPPVSAITASPGEPQAATAARAQSRLDAEDRDTARMAETEGSAPRSRWRVLIVEDHPDMRAFIKNALGSAYAITEASDGQEALALLEGGFLPDLVLSDIMMPRMDGTTLLARLRDNPRYAAIPFIFLTARDESAEKIELLRSGSIDYIVKPFSLGELRARIEAVLNQRDRERNEMRRKVDTALSFASAQDGEPSLTLREEEVLKLLLTGVTDKEIAERLGISARTASNHVAAILRKTGLSSRQSLMQRFGK